MLEVAEKCKDQLQIAFKPHPNLRGKLNEAGGKEKTDKYYQQWKNLPNGQLEQGAYIDLFLESDGMIHDSGSFLLEYLFTNKPVMFLMGSEKVKEEFNDLGKQALRCINLGYSKEVIIHFIEEILISGIDNSKSKRLDFVKQYLSPPNNRLSSENIYSYLTKTLNSEKNTK